MKISNFLNEIKSRNGFLYYIGLLHVVFLFVFFIAYFFDSRLILGINPWIKPMKFAISIAAYSWTFGWILDYLENSKRFVKIVSFLIGFSMLGEMIPIALQSFRGVQSHFNIYTQIDGMIFSIMGIMILINTLAIFLCFIWFLIKKSKIEFPYLLSIKLAFIVFILANLIGGMMIGNGAHSIGGQDGEAGMAFVNWSLDHGDLRIAHFMGLHSIQIIPLFAFYIASKFFKKFEVGSIIIFTLIYAGIFAAIYFQAIQGKPLMGF